MLDVKEAVGPVKEAAPEKVSKTRDIEKQRGYLVAPKFSPAQINLIRRMYAKGLDNDEFSVFIYIARAYGLDPIKGEISVHVRYADDPQRRQIIPIVGRDGFLTIAHRSGAFGGMKAGTKEVNITLPSGEKKVEIQENLQKILKKGLKDLLAEVKEAENTKIKGNNVTD